MAVNFDRYRFLALRVLFLVLFLTTVPAYGAESLFSPAMLPDDGYTETFSISADLDNGGFAQIQLGVTNMGPGSGRAVCRVLLVSPQASWRSQKMISPGDWQVRSATDGDLEIGRCAVREGERISFDASTEEGTIEILVEQGLVPQAGDKFESQVKSGSFTVFPLAAGVPAKVTIRPRKATSQLLSARVYIEHDLGTVSPDQIGRQWFRFRTADGDPVQFGVARRSGKQNQGAGRLITSSTGAVAWPGLTLESTEEPGTGAILLTSPERTITMRPTRTIAAYAPLREMGIVGRVLSAIVGDPLLSILEVTWEEGAVKRKAILEVTTFR